MRKRLRILMVIPCEWDERLGMAQVVITLRRELEKLGHHCDKLSAEDMGLKMSRLGNYFRYAQIRRHVRRFIQAHGSEYDVIQVEHDILTRPYRKGGHSCVLIAKSQLLSFYVNQFEWRKEPRLRWHYGQFNLRYGFGYLWRLARSWLNGPPGLIWRGLQAADCVHVLNPSEKRTLTAMGIREKNIWIVSNALTEAVGASNEALSLSSRSPQSRTIAFIGYWCTRKGSLEIPQILRRLRAKDPSISMLLLGTGVETETVAECFDPADREYLEIIARFPRESLGGLLSRARVGLFPSYVEGFGLGLLEMLTAGLPCVSWDIPGPDYILEGARISSLVPAGEIEATVQALGGLLHLEGEKYCEAQDEAHCLAERFSWEATTRAWLESVYESLKGP